MIAKIGRIKLEGGRVLVGDVLAIDRQWLRKLHDGRDQNDRTVSVSGCYSATTTTQAGGILNPADATGGAAAVCRLDAEAAEVNVIYDEHGRRSKIEIIAIR